MDPSMSSQEEQGSYCLSLLEFPCKRWLSFGRLVICSKSDPKFLLVKTQDRAKIEDTKLIRFDNGDVSKLQKEHDIVLCFTQESSCAEFVRLASEFYGKSDYALKNQEFYYPLILSIAELTSIHQTGKNADLETNLLFFGMWKQVLISIGTEKALVASLFVRSKKFIAAWKESKISKHEPPCGFFLSIIDLLTIQSNLTEDHIIKIRECFHELELFDITLFDAMKPK